MIVQIIIGSLTLLSGATLVAIGTDFGKYVTVSPAIIVGSVMTLLGVIRLKNALDQRK